MTLMQTAIATDWKCQHSVHVERMTSDCADINEPEQKDSPELWAPANWNWFINDLKSYAF